MSRYWSDGYLTADAELDMEANFGFGGLLGKKVTTILGGTENLVLLPGGIPFGSESFGSQPFGGGTTDESIGLPNSGVTMNRFWCVDTFAPLDFTEFYMEYRLLKGQFALVSHGSNMFDAGTTPITHAL
jgi:hypothetical protein